MQHEGTKSTKEDTKKFTGGLINMDEIGVPGVRRGESGGQTSIASVDIIWN
jgi:hypothetical protein